MIWPTAARDLAARADEKAARGEAQRSAALLDDARGDWERIVPMLESAPAQQLEARRRLAATAFRAWEMTPSRARAEAAREVLEEYVKRAPAGASKVEAESRLARVNSAR